MGAGGQGGGGRARLASDLSGDPSPPAPSRTRARARASRLRGGAWVGRGLGGASAEGSGNSFGPERLAERRLRIRQLVGPLLTEHFRRFVVLGEAVALSTVRRLQQVGHRGPGCNTDFRSRLDTRLLRRLPSDSHQLKARPRRARSDHFRPHLSRCKMAEEPESALQLPPATAAEGDGPTEVSPETATPEPPSSASVSPGTEEPAGDTKKKIDILLKAVGDTPIMKTKKWAVERTRTIQGLIDFIKKFLKLVASEQLFIYVNQSFAPSPDQEVGTLYECFGSDGKLVLHYCKSQAWG